MEERSGSSDGVEIGQNTDREGSQGANGEERRYDYDSSRQRRNKMRLKQDRISAMPDAILHHILSFLPTKDAVKTSTLSQRWLHLWTFVPSLDFTCSSERRADIRRFIAYFDRNLRFHECRNINKFRVTFFYDYMFASHVTEWLHFATSCNVRELFLDLREKEVSLDFTDAVNYKLPRHIYTNSSITKLSLSGCDLVPERLISWKWLKSLSIGYSSTSGDLIEKILAGSPSLEFLELCGFSELDRLNVGSVSLRELVIRDQWDFDYSVLEISAPNLCSLSIMGTMNGKQFRLMDVQSLVDCNLNFNQSLDGETDFEEHENALREILDRLDHVKKLTMGNWCIQVLAKLAMKAMVFPVSKRECLMLATHIEQCDIPGIAGLLPSSPNLETLVINATFLDCSVLLNEIDHRWTLPEWSSKCSLMCLKTIEIVGFSVWHLESEHVIQLVQSFIQDLSTEPSSSYPPEPSPPPSGGIRPLLASIITGFLFFDQFAAVIYSPLNYSY